LRLRTISSMLSLRKGSNQSNAKEFDRHVVHADRVKDDGDLVVFLNDLTTHYYAEQVMDWIKSKIKQD